MNKRDEEFCETENVKEQVILQIMFSEIILSKAQSCTFWSWYNFMFLVLARLLKMHSIDSELYYSRGSRCAFQDWEEIARRHTGHDKLLEIELFL